MTEQIDTIIIGGGQGGLSTSYQLMQQGREHVVLEQAEQVAEAWRNRWDSFTLITPNWMIRLPGAEYQGDDPDGFAARDKVIAYFEEYVERFELPIKYGYRVTSVEPIPAPMYEMPSEAIWESDWTGAFDNELMQQEQAVLYSTNAWFRRGFWYAQADVVALLRTEGEDVVISADNSAAGTNAVGDLNAPILTSKSADPTYSPGTRLTIGRFLGHHVRIWRIYGKAATRRFPLGVATQDNASASRVGCQEEHIADVV